MAALSVLIVGSLLALGLSAIYVNNAAEARSVLDGLTVEGVNISVSKSFSKINLRADVSVFNPGRTSVTISEASGYFYWDNPENQLAGDGSQRSIGKDVEILLPEPIRIPSGATVQFGAFGMEINFYDPNTPPSDYEDIDILSQLYSDANTITFTTNADGYYTFDSWIANPGTTFLAASKIVFTVGSQGGVWRASG